MTNEQAYERLRKILDNVEYLTKTKDGTYEGKLYGDDQYEMSYKRATSICNSDDPDSQFFVFMDDTYCDVASECHYDLRMDIEDIFRTSLKGNEDVSDDFISNTVEDYLAEVVSWKYPDDHFLDQKFRVNILLDTGDGNYDYSLNSLIPPCWYSKETEPDDRSSLVWLAKQQGYAKQDLVQAGSSEDKEEISSEFLKSCCEELENLSTHMSAVTFLVEMPLRDIIKLNKLIRLADKDGHEVDADKRPYCGSITLDKSTVTGLFDPWSGSGSVFDISLEKDVVIPISHISSALPDGGCGYSIDQVYGFTHESWDDTVKEIKEPDKQ